MPHPSTRKLVTRIGDLATRFGLRRTTGQILAALLVSEEPMSLDDLTEAVGVSKASVSIYARELAALGAIRKVWAPDTRRDLYEAEGDFGAVLRRWAETGLRRRVDEVRSVLSDLEGHLSASTGGDDRLASSDSGSSDRPRVRARLQAARRLCDALTKLVDLAPTLLGSVLAPTTEASRG